jgi:hypothetical protein
MNLKTSFDTIGMPALKPGLITILNITRTPTMKPTAEHMQAYGILLTLSLSECVRHHLTIGKRVSHQGFSHFFFFTFILFFYIS